MANTKDELINKDKDNRDKGELIPPKKKEPVDPDERELLTD